MIPVIKNENDIRRLAGIPIKEDPIDIPPDDDDEAEDWGVPSKPSGSLDNIIAKHREAFESVMRGESSLYDHDEFYDELYEHYVSSGEMPYGIAKARDGDPDQWIQEELDREYGDDFATDDGEPMDGDFDSGMASAGLGTDEDYGYYGESKGLNEYGRGTDDKGNKFYITKDNKKFADEKTARDYERRNPNLSWPKKPKTFKEHFQAVQEGFGQYHYKATPDGNFSYKGKTYSSEQSARRAETDDKAARMASGKDYKDRTPGPVTDPWDRPTKKS